ncbi:MAG TPA: type IV toxin-antitoxin system AbiEi family antitoxin domain-containing protein [Solirubrobacterales bacterium]|nr:type IV toxin-antitoxin system AbiEi family antitoxin domain-containing protein [Solirubrobacterales bacterium]
MAELARAQYGVVSFRQLRELGFSKGAIGRAHQAERLHQLHHGVYAVGHIALSDHGRCMAAILACGRRAVLSHESAAWLWGFFPTCPVKPEVSVPNAGRPRAGVRAHRVVPFSLGEVGSQEGIPVTSPARTLLDLAATNRGRRLQQAIEKAKRLDRLDLAEIDALIRHKRSAPGTRRLREAAEIYRDPAISRSRPELLFLDLVKRAGLPRPALNTFVAGHEIDAYWEVERFAVEVDGWDAHRTREAFEADPLRQENLKLAGIDSIRVTARRVEREPAAVAERLRRLLASRREELRH